MGLSLCGHSMVSRKRSVRFGQASALTTQVTGIFLTNFNRSRKTRFARRMPPKSGTAEPFLIGTRQPGPSSFDSSLTHLAPQQKSVPD